MPPQCSEGVSVAEQVLSSFDECFPASSFGLMCGTNYSWEGATSRKPLIKTFSATCSQNHHVNPFGPSPCLAGPGRRRQATSFDSVPCTRARIAYSLSCCGADCVLAALATFYRSRVVGCLPVAFIKLFETDPPPRRLRLPPFCPFKARISILAAYRQAGGSGKGTKAESLFAGNLSECAVKLRPSLQFIAFAQRTPKNVNCNSHHNFIYLGLFPADL